MSQIAFRFQVKNYKAADLGMYIDAANALSQRLERELPMGDVVLLDVAKSDTVMVNGVTTSDVVNPTASSTIWNRTGIAGAAAGNHTVTGIRTTDVLAAVLHVDDTTVATTDVTSEYTISATNTINNTSGTSSVGSHIVVVYYRPPTGQAAAI